MNGPRRRLAAMVIVGAAGLLPVYSHAQVPKPASKMMYVLPFFPGFSSGSDAEFAVHVADLRQRLGEGPFVRVGFNRYVLLSMDQWNIDINDRAAVRAALAPTIQDFDRVVNRARTHNIPVSISLVSHVREQYDAVQRDAEREDRRVTQWYADGAMAPGWMTMSRYARKLKSRYEAYTREVGAVIANRMAKYPANLVAVSGDGEVELSFERSPPFSAQHPNAASIEVTDYSPFAIAEFRDWLRNGGLYAAGQPFAGQGYAQAARYAGDASPAVDSNGDGRTLNGDFGTTFNSWSLRHFDWSLTDDVTVDPNAIPAIVYDRQGFNARPGTDPGRFDAPRVRQPGQAWWDVFERFRQEMVWHYNLDFARWITTTPDPETGQTVPNTRWFSHQIPADYVFGWSPATPDVRFLTSASAHWTADISPYGGLGITAFTVNLGNNRYARTLPAVIPHIAARDVRWAILEWNPSLPVSNSLALYENEMAIIEQYRPAVIVPWAWDFDSFYQVKNTPFELALRDMIARIKDGPVRSAPALPLLDALMSPDADRQIRDITRKWPSLDAIRERQATGLLGREPRRWER